MNADNRSIQIHTRLAALRAAMTQANIKACVIPSSDPHLSEYLPERYKAREWLSGFSGSMGTLVVTLTEAAVFADSRYWEQAERELKHTGVLLEKIPTAAGTHHLDWLCARLSKADVAAVDGTVMGLAATRALRAAIEPTGASLRTDIDMLETVWHDRPPLPVKPIYAHTAPQANIDRTEKLRNIRQSMTQVGAQWHFISTLDDLAWALNLRGQDVEYNPVFLAHALVGLNEVTLFVDASKVPSQLLAQLNADGISLAPYETALSALSKIASTDTVLIDPKRITWAYRCALSESVRVVEQINPSALSKSKKNATEAQFIRDTMEQDGAALCEFFAWFESRLNKERITELTIDEQITAARARRENFVCPSFSTIAGFNANGALPHYRATPEAHSVIQGNGLLLIDSGGQYKGGTTDITRVLPINKITNAMKRDFTLVLRGMINLTLARFPRGTLSPMLDALARIPLWQAGVDFGHGTGHGVGYFLNVHEGPQSISRSVPDANMAMELGMITSNEPGLYRPGQWGIRVENLVMNVPFTDHIEGTTFGEFLQFETLTLCPIDTRCVERSMLRADELLWLNTYHANVRARLSKHVSSDARAWLEKRTQAI